MPKSKRKPKIEYSKTCKKGLALKQHIVEDIRSCVEKYDRIFILSIQNMRNSKLKDLRMEWKDSRFFFGKNKVLTLALGKTPEEEASEGLHKLSNALKGQACLLFTNKNKEEVLDWMNQYEELDYARSGFVPAETISVPEGPLPQFSHSIEPHLRNLGMPTALQKGVVTLLQEFRVCKKGTPLTPEQARILKLLEKPLASFKVIPLGVYSKGEGFVKLASKETTQDEEEMETDNEENT